VALRRRSSIVFRTFPISTVQALRDAVAVIALQAPVTGQIPRARGYLCHRDMRLRDSCPYSRAEYHVDCMSHSSAHGREHEPGADVASGRAWRAESYCFTQPSGRYVVLVLPSPCSSMRPRGKETMEDPCDANSRQFVPRASHRTFGEYGSTP